MVALERFKSLQLDRPLMAIAVHPRAEQLVAVAGGRPDQPDSGLISILDYEAGRLLGQLLGHEPLTRTLAFAPDGLVLASGGRDGCARLWHLDAAKDGKPFAEMRHGFPVLGVAFSPDGRWVATAAGSPNAPGQAGLFRVEDGSFVRSFDGHRSGVYSMAFSPDGALVASSGIDQTLRVHEVATGKQRFVLEGHAAPCWTVAYRADGLQIASGSHDGTVKLWSARTGELEKTLEGHGGFVASVAYHPSLDLLLATDNEGSLHVWDPRTGASLASAEIGPAWGAAFSASGRRLVLAHLDARAQVFQVGT